MEPTNKNQDRLSLACGLLLSLCLQGCGLDIRIAQPKIQPVSELNAGATTLPEKQIHKLLELHNNELASEVLGLQHLMLQLRLLNEWLLATEGTAEQPTTLLVLEKQFCLGQNLHKWFHEGLRQYRKYDKATQVLQNSLLDLLAEVRGVTKHYNDKLLALVLNSLKDSNTDLRQAAMKALVVLLSKGTVLTEALPRIQNALKGSSGCTRELVIVALPLLVDKGVAVAEVLPYVRLALRDREWYIRRSATVALVTLLKKGATVAEVLPHIQIALHDRDAYVRRAAVAAFVPLTDEGTAVAEILPGILNAFKDSDSYIRQS
ncbi:MAG: hypothetical protein AAF706_03275, partial [Bacteroidota bacterium]